MMGLFVKTYLINTHYVLVIVLGPGTIFLSNQSPCHTELSFYLWRKRNKEANCQGVVSSAKKNKTMYVGRVNQGALPHIECLRRHL
jgi:hypothetical protein